MQELGFKLILLKEYQGVKTILSYFILLLSYVTIQSIFSSDVALHELKLSCTPVAYVLGNWNNKLPFLSSL